MSDDERDALLLRLHAEIELLRSVAAFLCVATIPTDALDAYIEGLDIPAVGNTPEATKAVHDILGRFVSQVSQYRGVREGKGQ